MGIIVSGLIPSARCQSKLMRSPPRSRIIEPRFPRSTEWDILCAPSLLCSFGNEALLYVHAVARAFHWRRALLGNSSSHTRQHATTVSANMSHAGIIVLLTLGCYANHVNGQGWTQIPRGLVQVSGNLNYIWGLDQEMKIYQCQRPCTGAYGTSK